MYQLKVTSNTEEYITLDGDFSLLRDAYRFEEYQFIHSQPMTVGVTLESGFEVPDIIAQDSLLFISEKMKVFLDASGLDYISYKKIQVHGEEYGIFETFYWMMIPRINCLDLESLPEGQEIWNYEDGLVPLIDVDRFSLDPTRFGRYSLFRVFGLYENTVFCTDTLYKKLEAEEFVGLWGLPFHGLQ